MESHKLEEVLDGVFAWVLNDFSYKPMEFWASPIGAERLRQYLERAADAALDAAGVERTD